MGLLDKLKHVVTGGAAKVVLVKHSGTLAAGELVYVKVEVEAVADVKSKGLFVDLHGEDDLDESVLDKAAELFNPDPSYAWPIAEAFELASGQKRVFENAISMPNDLVVGTRTWLVRARVEAPGKDPTSPWVKFGAP
jgi:hypothetical protein